MEVWGGGMLADPNGCPSLQHGAWHEEPDLLGFPKPSQRRKERSEGPTFPFPAGGRVGPGSCLALRRLAPSRGFRPQERR